MKSVTTKLVSREFRKYLYGVAIAAFPVAVYFGLIEPEAIPLVLPLIVALFNLTPKETPNPSESEQEDIINADDVTEV